MLRVLPFSWEIEDETGDNNTTNIHCWCLNENNETLLVRIDDYRPSIYVELPQKVNGIDYPWSQGAIKPIINLLLRRNGIGNVESKFLRRHKLYFHQEKKYPFIHLTFDTIKAMKSAVWSLTKPLTFSAIGKIKLNVWEDKIPLLTKFMIDLDLMPSQWLSVKATRVEPEDSISTLKQEYIASWRAITPLTDTKGLIASPKVLIYDIETYSHKPKAFPNPLNAKDACFMIGALFQRIGMSETRQIIIVIAGDCDDVEGVTLIKTKTDVECILAFNALIKEHDPDIIAGYNNHTFDDHYMNTRLEMYGSQWDDISRIIGENVTTKKQNRGAKQRFDFEPLLMKGRVNVDLLPVIRRDYKFPNYNLDTVASYFVGTGKKPIKPSQIFAAYRAYLEASTEEEMVIARSKLGVIADYCKGDLEATYGVMDTIYWWISSLELSNIVGVTIDELYSRGQQVRGLAMVYRDAHIDGCVVDFYPPLNIVFTGGDVTKPIQGVADDVPCYDFNSLYPSIIEEYNIDYTTLIHDKLSPTVDEADTNIIEFDQLERVKKSSDSGNGDVEITDKDGKWVHRRIKFIKKEKKVGILPRIVRRLVDERVKVKKLIAALNASKEKVSAIDLAILDKRQWALKITANAVYGFVSAYVGKLPLIEAGMAVTAWGRQMITKVSDYLVATYGAIIVYGDTDSKMPYFPHLKGKSWPEKYKFWVGLQQELTDLFPGRITIELEKVMRGIFFAPKMYAALIYDKDGNIGTSPDKMLVKGIILARRDGSPWMRDCYRRILFNILSSYSPILSEQCDSITRSFDIIVEAALELKEGRVNWEQLAKINEIGSNYKNKKHQLAILSTHLAQIGKAVQPGERIRYLICDIPGEKTIGPKLRTDDEFIESQEEDNPLTLDTNYYMESLRKKIDPLFKVGYNLPAIAAALSKEGYKPNSLKHFVSLLEPVRMLARLIEDGRDITTQPKQFKEYIYSAVLDPKPTKKRIVVVRKSTPTIIC